MNTSGLYVVAGAMLTFAAIGGAPSPAPIFLLLAGIVLMVVATIITETRSK